MIETHVSMVHVLLHCMSGLHWLFRDVFTFACSLLLNRLAYAFFMYCFWLWSALNQSSWIRHYTCYILLLLLLLNEICFCFFSFFSGRGCHRHAHQHLCVKYNEGRGKGPPVYVCWCTADNTLGCGHRCTGSEAPPSPHQPETSNRSILTHTDCI